MSQTEDKIVSLVELAARQERLSGLDEIVRFVGESLDAAACLLWQVAPHSRGGQEENQRLHSIAKWAKGDSGYSSYYLPFSSLSGFTIQSDSAIATCLEGPRASKTESFIGKMGFKSLCCAPLKLGKNVRGALNIYRDTSEPFSEGEIAMAQSFANVLPTLYDLIREKAAFALIRIVRSLIESAETEGRTSDAPVLALCNVLSEHLSCVETSIFLEDRLRKPGEFELRGSTCTEYVRKHVYTTADQGITGWVLQNKKPVRIFDLAHFDREMAEIQEQYPGLTWQLIDIHAATRKVLNLDSDADVPPFSFMAVPIMMGGDVLGVIRCCTLKRAPYYFSSADVELLHVLASQIGHFWNGRLVRQEMESEISSWRTFAAGIQTLTTFALTELESPQPDKKKIYQEGLNIASKVIPGADILDVRLYDSKAGDLFFFVEYGDAWRGEEPPTTRFPVTGDHAASAGARAFRNNKCYVILDVQSNQYYRPAFPTVRRMIIAPISSRNQQYGVLDIGGRGLADFPRQAVLMVTLFGQQLGLFHILASAIGDLNQTSRVQARSYEDLEHQLHSPIRQALERLSALTAGTVPEDRREYSLQAVRGLIAKAHHVVRSIAIFSTLHNGSSLKIDASLLTEHGLTKSLIEISSDNRLLLGTDLGVEARVDRRSLALLNEHKVYADTTLLEQALQNVIENGFKYSHPHTIIQITGGIWGRYFGVSVRNQGIPLTEDEVGYVVKRGWRGPIAQSVTPSGSGIGLWLADNILKAHNGKLEIIPTRLNRLTEIRLLLPVSP